MEALIREAREVVYGLSDQRHLRRSPARTWEKTKKPGDDGGRGRGNNKGKDIRGGYYVNT